MHEPDDYDCPFCRIQQGLHNEHNQPAGNQDVWHLHVHVFPRHTDDLLYERHRSTRWVTPEERAPYADRLAAALGLPRTFA